MHCAAGKVVEADAGDYGPGAQLGQLLEPGLHGLVGGRPPLWIFGDAIRDELSEIGVERFWELVEASP